ncbi:interferon-inducible GTPase 5-like [Parambassis ranga]|uniref:Interferon-inducible GTPase 5-like n=1 Tax=Parambassis ranga TaxID=210632 RepID=A0A6P7HM32_9TELE|nr:interferon-inducible GTPase 5-like [Parambassis ranga]XP_028251623.1 interferon-inducible GTPase 5-like [Parambassis ranga]
MEAETDAEIRQILQNSDQSLAAAQINEVLERQNNVPLNIAVTGETGAGKSTFINAFRDLNDEDEGAALTGCKETTKEVTAYPHPNYPNVTFWDLPGIGTTNFPAKKYKKKVGLEKFDFFIIISAHRFTENDVKLAKEIKKMKKTFYFVRSKIDSDLDNEKRSRKSNFNKEKTLTDIKEDCIKGLQDAGFESPQVFLVSSFELHEYDFSLLQETLERELPEHKRDALLMTTPITSLEIIAKKKKAFKSKIKYWAAASAAGAAVPVPGLSIAVDVSILIAAITQYVHGFGLDIPTMKRVAARTGVSYDDLLAVIVSPLAAAEVTPTLLLRVMASLAGTAALMAAEEGSRFIPILGIPIAMGLSYVTTSRVLSHILNILTEDSERVFRKAFGSK